jgi:acetyl esterase/lipase
MMMASQELERVLQLLREYVSPEPQSIGEMRAEFEANAKMFTVVEDTRCEPFRLENMQAEWIVHRDAFDERVVLYLHGGGYVMGSIETHRAMISRISRAAAARVLLIGYRLAPEHPYPAALEDSTAAYQWLLAEGWDPARMAIAGDSAGGGLSIATLVRAREATVPLPAAMVCVSAWVDLEGIGESMTTKADVDPIVQREHVLLMARAYLGGANPRTPLAAPLYADLRGLPPMLIQVGGSETLMDDSLRLAARARGAGVEVILEPWEDMFHVWHYFASLLPEGQQAIERIGSFIRENTE